MLDLKLDAGQSGPIYRQIAASIAAQITSGKLPPGYKLPTVRALAGHLGAACGTVKHAYESLEEQGFVEMVQGRGSFVCDTQTDTGSRKERAMNAIDKLFDRLQHLGFTPREMEIYLNLKLQGLEETYDTVRVAVVDCNPETLHLIEKQLAQIGYVQTALFALHSLAETAPRLNTDFDLVLTTATHFAEVEPYLQQPQRLAMVAMTPALRTVIQLAKVPADAGVGIFCASDAFSGLVRKNCAGLGPWSERMRTCLMGMTKEPALSAFLSALTHVIVPAGYEAFAGPQERAALRAFAQGGGEIVPYDYQIDHGSFLYVTDRIKKCMDQKRNR